MTKLSNTQTILRVDLVEAARSYLGVRWMHQGRSPLGVDCVGLLICAGGDVGLSIPDMKGYRRTPQPDVFVRHILDNSNEQSGPLIGNFGIFRDGTQPCHVGIFGEQYGQPSLIHSFAGTGKVMEEPFDPYWQQRCVAYRSMIGLED